ncbi:MAG: hypothetical protein AAGU27_04060 [Dehalobacterium sp.]
MPRQEGPRDRYLENNRRTNRNVPRKIKGQSRSEFPRRIFDSKGGTFAAGFGSGVLTTMLLPSVVKSFRPAVVAALQGLMSVSDQLKETTSSFRENLEDIISEAQFDRIKNDIDTELTKQQNTNKS